MDLWTGEAACLSMAAGPGPTSHRPAGKDEKLSGGGVSSGLMSLLRIGDQAAGSIKSGGVMRRAAKMVASTWITRRSATLSAGRRAKSAKRWRCIWAASYWPRATTARSMTPIGKARRSTVSAAKTVTTASWVHHDFLDRVDGDSDWELTARTDGSVVSASRPKTCGPSYAPPRMPVPILRPSSSNMINRWHICPSTARSTPATRVASIRSDNMAGTWPASIWLALEDDGDIDIAKFTYAACIWTTASISSLMASFPSREIALGLDNHRTLALAMPIWGPCRCGWPHPMTATKAAP